MSTRLKYLPLMQSIQKEHNFQSTKLVYGAYECNWYDLSAKDAKNLMIIVHRSRIPLRLTAGKFGIFSLEMLGAVSISIRKNMLFCLYVIVTSTV